MSVTRSWTIGADPACDLVIAQDYVSGRHCRLTKTDSGVILEDLGSTNGTYVNGERIWSPRTVQPQDQITLGKLTAMPWPPELTSPAPPAANARVLTVGRGPENDVVLDYPTVSTRHARVLIEGGSYSIEDLGSTNGTFLNSLDRRVTRSPFTLNDTVYFGTQPIPASRLLPGVSAAKATVAINAQQMAAMVAAQEGKAAPSGKPAARPAAPPPVPVASSVPAGASSGSGRSAWLPLYIGGGLGGLLLVVLVALLLGRGKPEVSSPPKESEAGVESTETATAGAGTTDASRKPGSGAPSTAAASGSMRAVYAVLAERSVPNLEQQEQASKLLSHVGTASAVGERVLLTSGEIAADAQRYLGQSWVVRVYQPETGKDLVVQKATPHPEFQRALGEFQTAEAELRSGQEKLNGNAAGGEKKEGEADPPSSLSAEDAQKLVERLIKIEDRMLEMVERMTHYDVGTLEVEEAMPERLPISAEAATIELGTKVRLAGFPTNLKEREIQRQEIGKVRQIDSARFRQRASLVESTGVKQQSVVLFLSDIPENEGWMGAPILDAEGRMVAIYSHQTPPLKPKDLPSRVSADVVPRPVWGSLLPASLRK